MVDLDRVSPLGVQLLAAGLLGFAALNWVGRSAIYGGIYGRPIVLANFGYGIISVMTLASAVLDERLTSRVCRWASGAALAPDTNIDRALQEFRSAWTRRASEAFNDSGLAGQAANHPQRANPPSRTGT